MSKEKFYRHWQLLRQTNWIKTLVFFTIARNKLNNCVTIYFVTVLFDFQVFYHHHVRQLVL